MTCVDFRSWLHPDVLGGWQGSPLCPGALNCSSQHFILKGKMECFVMVQIYRRGFNGGTEDGIVGIAGGAGESLKAIGRAFGKPSSSIYCLVSPHGGICPAARRRSRLALTPLEREEISRGIVAQRSIRSIARSLGRSPSTVSREISRNDGHARYRAAQADTRAWARARRPKPCKLALSPWLRRTVARQLRLSWSPEQIAGWLKRAYPGEKAYQVSHETIYRSLFVQSRGVLKKELLQHLRSQRTMRRSRHASGERRWPRANQGHDLDP